jgi:hypothetical protein
VKCGSDGQVISSTAISMAESGLYADLAARGKLSDDCGRPIPSMQTKCGVPGRMTIRISVIHARDSSIPVQHSEKLDRPAQRALIGSISPLPARVSLRFLKLKDCS